MSDEQSLYARLGGYDAIVAVAEYLLPRLMNDEKLRRFWDHRGTDGLLREKQLLIDFLAHSAGGPMYYTGRNMETAHAGMKIDESDWERFIGHLTATLDHFGLAEAERTDALNFIESTKDEIVEM